MNSDRAIDARWLTGWLGTWFILSLLAENESTAGLASAIAVTVAGSVAFVLIPTIQPGKSNAIGGTINGGTAPSGSGASGGTPGAGSGGGGGGSW